jgi:hypothetical protein
MKKFVVGVGLQRQNHVVAQRYIVMLFKLHNMKTARTLMRYPRTEGLSDLQWLEIKNVWKLTTPVVLQNREALPLLDLGILQLDKAETAGILRRKTTVQTARRKATR